MFVPRSARRIRLARLAFVLAAVLPTAALAAWAVHRHSAAHRAAVLRGWEEGVGLPIAAASVEHPLPGTIRAHGCTLAAPDGTVVLEADSITVDHSPTEVRLAIGGIDCGPAGAAVLAGLAGEWLWRGARFRRDLVVDVAAFAWEVPGVDGPATRHPLGRVRIECVAQPTARAVRIVRRDADDGVDEVRVVRFTADGGDGAAGERLEIAAACAEPLPAAVLAAVAPGCVAGLSLGPSATVRGRLTVAHSAGRWHGTADGRVEGVDLAACTAMLPAGTTGTMTIDVDRLELRDGRLAACAFACEATAGRADRRLLEALIGTIGCRAGAGYLGATADRDREFDAAGCAVRIDGRGIDVRGAPRLGGALAVVGGRSLLDPPAGIVSPERLAWLFAPPGAVYVPSSGAGAWLMSVLPRGGEAVERTSRGASAGSEADF